MTNYQFNLVNLRRLFATSLAAWLILLSPLAAIAQEAVDASGNPTGPSEPTGAQGCTGAGCNQGVDQGVDNGGPTLADLGGYVDESGNEVLPAGVTDTRQGAGQGMAQGSSNGLSATNSNTGAESTNKVAVDATNSLSDTTTNNSITNNMAGVLAATGGNNQNENTGTQGLKTGNAAISATVVTTDNTTTINGQAGFNNQTYTGDQTGPITVGFGAGTANLIDGDKNLSYQLVNKVTGASSTNDINIFSSLEEIIEVQNDGLINNDITVGADTGENSASRNTGSGQIVTGDADVAVTLINLLNTTVINGDIWVTVAEVFGNLTGDIYIPSLADFAGQAGSQLVIDANNGTTGVDSTNAIDITVTDADEFSVDNDAEINTAVNAAANTGDNDANGNTSGSNITTGDAHVAASNISVANTTVEGGNWGLFIVNALNGFLGFLVGEDGTTQALSADETIRHIEANNSQTGADSANTITVVDETITDTDITNNAEINNTITASANTGRNIAERNTGLGEIDTGDASIQASAINIANTTVKDGSLFIAVVNVFGDWWGNLWYGATQLPSSGVSTQVSAAAQQDVTLTADNSATGADSANTIDIDINKTHETVIINEADLDFTLNADINTGANRANRNTLGAAIKTGTGSLAQYSQAIANTTGIAGGISGLAVDAQFNNDITGFSSDNAIRAEINGERVVAITNDANLATILGALINTGNNEASQNTVGGNIASGDIDAQVTLENMVNRVLLALTASNVTVDAEFANQLTGALSTNLNDLTVLQDLLTSVLNSATIDNLIDLLLNTGGNTANENTGGSVSAAEDESAYLAQAAADENANLNPAAALLEGIEDESAVANDQSEYFLIAGGSDTAVNTDESESQKSNFLAAADKTFAPRVLIIDSKQQATGSENIPPSIAIAPAKDHVWQFAPSAHAAAGIAEQGFIIPIHWLLVVTLALFLAAWRTDRTANQLREQAKN